LVDNMEAEEAEQAEVSVEAVEEEDSKADKEGVQTPLLRNNSRSSSFPMESEEIHKQLLMILRQGSHRTILYEQKTYKHGQKILLMCHH
jgi:hypothetical protein